MTARKTASMARLESLLYLIDEMLDEIDHYVGRIRKERREML